MEASSLNPAVIIAIVVGLFWAYWAWRVVNWLWLRPKKLERYLRQQGLSGSSYTFFFGDLRQEKRMLREARSKPINISDDIKPRLSPFHHQSLKNFGKNNFTWIGPTPRVSIMNPEHIKEIFSKVYDYQKPTSNPLVRLLANGLTQKNGEKWARHRKIINPAFHLEKLKLMLPAFYSSCAAMVDRWDQLVSADKSYELDVWVDLQNLTREVISRTAFGSSFEEGKRIFELQEEQAELAMKAFRTVYVPGWRFVPTKMNRRMKNNNREIERLLMGIIRRGEKGMRAGKDAGDDLLGLLLESNMKENVGMSIREVIEECKLFYFAGQETTTTLLAWTLVLLSVHTDWQAKAREEVLQIFGTGKLAFDGLNYLKIVNMILYEVLRLYPPVILQRRKTAKEMVLGNLRIPAGVEISIPTIFVHHDQDLWGEDATEFKPERFAEGISKATRNRVSYFPFSWGPRICVGQNFALMEARMALTMILQRFTFELSPAYAHAPMTVIFLQPQFGVQVILHKASLFSLLGLPEIKENDEIPSPYLVNHPIQPNSKPKVEQKCFYLFYPLKLELSFQTKILHPNTKHESNFLLNLQIKDFQLF